MSPRIEFFFDYGSPYSYLADTQLADLCERTGAAIKYRPMLLGGVFKATGNQSPAMETVQNKLRYFGAETRRWVEHYGVPFNSNPNFPINTLLAMRTCVAAQHEGVFQEFHGAVYPAFWVDGQNMGDPEVIAGVLDRAGLDAKRLLERSSEAEIKNELRSNTEEAVERGAFGAPTFFVGDEMFFGADRLMFVEKAARKQG
ncbi:MAG: 2-hydroxychromene-2-carboxylate isomerase [bacterium]|nr:2-hydroxychromene-2-carboxylate isomerase [bacterium]